MSAKPESRLQASIRSALLDAYPGSYIFKVHGSAFQAAGIPDLVGCIGGRFVGLEVKLPGAEGTLTKRQDSALGAIRRAGGIASVVTSAPEALRIIAEHHRP